MYTSIGVRPFINARGTYTILSGSTMLPEVRAAMDQAARQYVHLDELTEAIGERLSTLTGAEWGLVTSGCAAALTHATAACVAGGNPDLHVRIPDLRGFAKDEVVIPKHSRNVYDAAIRAVGVRVVEATTLADFEAALGPRTAMVYVLAGPQADSSELNVAALAPLTRPRGVPILVDAAAEILTIPNVHLQNGATLVGYSGGKCLRGPQSAGLLLGRKDLVKAAWVHSAPHHGFARGDEGRQGRGHRHACGGRAVGPPRSRRGVAAVDGLAGGDRAARQGSGRHRVDDRNHTAGGIVEPHAVAEDFLGPQGARYTGEAVGNTLFHSEPRISLFPARGDNDDRTGVSITPYMLAPGDAPVIAARLHALLSSPASGAAAPPASPAADVTGTWTVRVAYAASLATHTLHLRQRGNTIDGSHQGDFISRELTGAIDGRQVSVESFYGEEHGDALNYRFTGTIDGDTMTGSLDMGEYLKATWSASRRERSSRR